MDSYKVIAHTTGEKSTAWLFGHGEARETVRVDKGDNGDIYIQLFVNAGSETDAIIRSKEMLKELGSNLQEMTEWI